MENTKKPMEVIGNAAEEQQVVTTTKKPLYKRWGFWLATALSVAGVCGGVYAYRKHAASKGAESEAPVAKNEVEQPRQVIRRDDNKFRHERNNSNNN